MSQYVPILEFYTNKLPLISSFYVSSETVFGVNVTTLCNPQDVSYTFIPSMSYFEFIRVDEANNDEIVDLVNVKLGCIYETLVTNRFGLYIYRMGDILQVTGFYNSAPQFKLVRRKIDVLSLQMEATTEEDLLKAMNHTKLILESSGLMLMSFTSYYDISIVHKTNNLMHHLMKLLTFHESVEHSLLHHPYLYESSGLMLMGFIQAINVLYWELKAKNINDTVKLDNKIMVQCCCLMEESFDEMYKNFRKEGSIRALEIKVVQQGMFDTLMEYFISKGSSAIQYKTPICVNSPEVLALLEDKVLAQFFSNRTPPL